MSPGEINLIFTQADYQHTVKINFKTKWYQRINKKVELNIYKLIALSLSLLIAEKVLTYAGRCLVYYTHN